MNHQWSSHGVVTVSRWVQAIIFGVTSGLSSSNLVLYRLWERDHYISAFAEFNEILESCQSGGAPSQARDMAKHEYAKRRWEEYQDPGIAARSRAQISTAVDSILQRGARWTALVTSLQSEEVLLVHEDRPLMDSTSTIGNVIDSGTDEDFENLKRFLLSEANNFKDCCLRLTGVSRLIFNLSNTPKEDSNLRSYLIKALAERINNIFGSAGFVAGDDLDEATKIEFDPLQLTIWQLFGINIKFTAGASPPDARPLAVPGGSWSNHHDCNNRTCLK